MLTDEEKKLLEKYVTSVEDNVFAVKGMEGLVGAAYARYSRAKGGFREVLLKEFIKEGIVDPKHADQLIERVLVAYGDDSVGELEGAHISFEQISMLATKEIEDRRIGGSPIEQSTRYVFYDQKDNLGRWRYLHHPSLTESPAGKLYVETMDKIFDIYAGLVEPMKDFFSKLKPLEDAQYDINGDGKTERFSELSEEKDQKAFRLTYTMDLRTKACDTLRCMLPLATLTNVGIFGNGRFFQHVISHLLTTDIPEAQDIAAETQVAASQVIPQYVRRAKRSEYLVAVRKDMFRLAQQLCDAQQPELPKKLPSITLLEHDTSPDTVTLAAMLFPYTNISISAIRKLVKKLSGQQRKEIIDTYLGNRVTRRDRPGRALEDGYPYTFEMVTNWGVYKDLMRHRMNTQQRQLFTTKIGFEMPKELVEAGHEEKVRGGVDMAERLYDSLQAMDPVLAQYAVLHGNYVRWSIGMNDREAMHLIELRTTPQGHSQYRKAAQEMHRQIAERCAWRGEIMKFADHNDYYWARADSEAKQRVKERKLEEKYNK